MPSTEPGVFTLSFDFELAWGEFHRGRPIGVERLLAARRIFPDLLRLLDRHRVAATFAVVGHLLLEGCMGHPAMPRPAIPWRPGDWYHGDPESDEKRDPAWYAPSLVRLLKDQSPGHDVGSHGFSHIPLDAPGVSLEVARAEIAESARGLHAEGFKAPSFVFPRNGINYTEVLLNEGFKCYRGRENRWWRESSRLVARGGHLLDQALALTPPVGLSRRVGAVVEAPSSMLFLSREGIRRLLPIGVRVARAHRGIAAAVASGRVFHLWMHVEDLVPGPEAMLDGLDRVLAEVRRRVDREEMVIRTMDELAA